MRIKLYADYCDWPLWGPRGQLPVNQFPLTETLRLRILAWLNAYTDSPRSDWPLWNEPDDCTDPEAAWVAEGEQIREALEAELGPDHEVALET